MTPRDQQDFATGFMDDYFAEAEDHLVAVRRHLLTLESALGGDVPADVLEELFRRFHSLKGISAMVELREAETLAHQMESCLRAVRQDDVVLGPGNFETLLDGARALDEVVAAYRRGTTPEPVDGVIEKLQTLAQSRTRPPVHQPGAPVSARTTDSGAHAGGRTWLVTFTSSPEFVKRGVKVDTIRSRLLQIGRILNVTPRVLGAGGIAFVFEVETEREDQLAAWRDDGIQYEPMGPDAGLSSVSEASVAGASEPVSAHRQVFPTSAANFVRVDLARLDELMRFVGDMVVTRARLDDVLDRIERYVPFQEWRALQEHTTGLERHLRDLRDGVMRVRLVPVGEIFRRMPFVVRDLAHDSGKQVQLELVGQSTEIDKFLIERMMDPILHLVRNAISHGIETPAERMAAGKPASGTIRLAASTSGESVVLQISDDGRGIDATDIAARARARGIAVPEGPLDSHALLQILCTSGFSTRQEADRASGRGVGMAVVRSTAQELGGRLDLESEPGRGTTFTMALPVTLAITDAIIAHVGDQIFAVPQSAVREIIEVDAATVQALECNELVAYRGGTLPVVRIAQRFAIPVTPRPRLHAIVVGVDRGAVGLLVDRIVGQREIVVKATTDPLIHVEGVSGATELGDGRLVLILDVFRLARTARERSLPPVKEARPA